MSDKSTFLSSLNLIDEINDDFRAIKHFFGIVADCAKNVCNAESEGSQGIFSLKLVNRYAD